MGYWFPGVPNVVGAPDVDMLELGGGGIIGFCGGNPTLAGLGTRGTFDTVLWVAAARLEVPTGWLAIIGRAGMLEVGADVLGKPTLVDEIVCGAAVVTRVAFSVFETLDGDEAYCPLVTLGNLAALPVIVTGVAAPPVAPDVGAVTGVLGRFCMFPGRILVRNYYR